MDRGDAGKKALSLTLSAALIVAGLATVHVQAQELDLGNWDVIFTYEMNATTGELVDYSQDGIYDEYVSCSGTWDLTVNETQQVDDDGWTRQYAWDVLEGELGYVDIHNGTEEKRVYKCDLFTIETADPGPDTSKRVCTGDTGSLKSAAEDHAFAPSSNGFAHEVTWKTRYTGACIKAIVQGGGSTNVPYSGHVRATLYDDLGNRVLEVRFSAVASVVLPGTVDRLNPTEYGNTDCCSWTYEGGANGVEHLSGLGPAGTFGAEVLANDP